MKTRSRQIMNLLTGIFLAGSCLTICGTGFRIPDQDAFATARGEAFTATADNPSAIYYNPAGLTQLEGQNVRGGIYGLYYNPQYTSPSTDQHFDGRDAWFAIPQIFYSYNFESMPMALGIGVYSPYGLSGHWDDNTGCRTLGTRASIHSYTINPTVAYEI